MNKQKKPYIKPGIIFEDFRTGELRGTPEMIEKYTAAASQNTKEQRCPFEDIGFPCSIRSGN